MITKPAEQAERLYKSARAAVVAARRCFAAEWRASDVAKELLDHPVIQERFEALPSRRGRPRELDSPTFIQDRLEKLKRN